MAMRWWIAAAVLAAAATTAAGQGVVPAANGAAGPASSLYQHAAAQSAVQQAADPTARPVELPVRSLIAAPEPAPRTFARNDLITIIIREQASHSSSAKTATERDSEIDASVDEFINVHALPEGKIKPVNFTDGQPAIVAEGTREFDGTGSNARTDSLAARIEGRIVDIRPNGNLVIEASKKITTDEESYTIAVSGLCKTQDVTPDNTILSTQIAELEIVKTSTGAVKDATKRGWLHRLLDAVNVF